MNFSMLQDSFIHRNDQIATITSLCTGGTSWIAGRVSLQKNPPETSGNIQTTTFTRSCTTPTVIRAGPSTIDPVSPQKSRMSTTAGLGPETTLPRAMCSLSDGCTNAQRANLTLSSTTTTATATKEPRIENPFSVPTCRVSRIL